MLSEDHVRWAFKFFAPEEEPSRATIRAILENCRTTAALRDYVLVRSQYFRRHPDFLERVVDWVAGGDAKRAAALRPALAVLSEPRIFAIARARAACDAERIQELEEEIESLDRRLAARAAEAEEWRAIEAHFLHALSRSHAEFRAIFRASRSERPPRQAWPPRDA